MSTMSSALGAHVTVEKRYVLECATCGTAITDDEGDASDVVAVALEEGWRVHEGAVYCSLECQPATLPSGWENAVGWVMQEGDIVCRVCLPTPDAGEDVGRVILAHDAPQVCCDCGRTIGGA